MKRAIQRAASLTCSWAVVVVLPFLGANRCVADQSAGPRAGDSDTCELRIDGKQVEKLTLVSRAGTRREIDRPKRNVSLPPGEYRVQEVRLEGGYAHYAGAREAWFSLTPGRPHQLTVGAPLEPQLELTRTGRIVQLDHQLLDADGRDYHFRGIGTRLDPPQFTVCRAERQIGSGSFEYG